MARTPEVTGYSELVEIGRGGFARVYRAHQDRFNRAVALKVLNLADPDERTRDRFERECRAMGELSWHPHVVAVYDSGITDDGHLWLAMEHLDRGSLANAVTETSVLDWPGAATAGIEVCGALGAAHAAGTLHRDLKPENVLVGPFGEAKLADFGIAAVDGGRRTTTGVASFTVAHVAPEVLRGQRQDERTDVYGLASTLHTLLAGSPPFQGSQDEPVAAVMMRIIEQPPPRLGAPVPGELADLLIAGLSKDPDDRPQTAAAFGEALQAIQRDHDLAVTPLRLAATGPTTQPVPVVPAAIVDPEPTPVGDDQATVVTDLADLPPADAAPAGSDASVPPARGAEAAPDPDETITAETPAAPPVPPMAEEPPPQPPLDSALESPSPTDSGGGGRRNLVIAGVVVVAVLVVGAVVLLVSGGGDDDAASAAGTFQTAQFATAPNAVAVNADAVWVTDAADSLIYKLDPVTGEEITNTGMNNIGTGIALTDDDAGWVIGDDTAAIIRIDLPTNGDTNQVEIGEPMTSISAVGTDVWITKGADDENGQLVRFDATNLEATASIDLVERGPNFVAATDDVVWVANSDDPPTVTRIDPDTNRETAIIDLDAPPSAIAAVEDAVWVLSTDSTKLIRIDPDTNEVVATVALGDDSGPVAVAATSDAVWVVANETDRVLRVDPATNQVNDEIEVSHEPVAVAATDNDVWVANSGDGTLTHIDPAAFTAELAGDAQGSDTVTEAEVRAFYDENQSQFEQSCVSHILADDETTADNLLNELEAGADFATLARENSTDTGSAVQGGDLGCQAPGTFVPDFEAAIDAAAVGEVFGPVETEFGFHLILVSSKDVQPFGDVDEEIRQQLEQ